MSATEDILQGIKAVSPLVRVAEDNQFKSCLLCFKFRFRDHATLIVCDKCKLVYSVGEMTTEQPTFKRTILDCESHAHLCPYYEEEM